MTSSKTTQLVLYDKNVRRMKHVLAYEYCMLWVTTVSTTHSTKIQPLYNGTHKWHVSKQMTIYSISIFLVFCHTSSDPANLPGGAFGCNHKIGKSENCRFRRVKGHSCGSSSIASGNGSNDEYCSIHDNQFFCHFAHKYSKWNGLLCRIQSPKCWIFFE